MKLLCKVRTASASQSQDYLDAVKALLGRSGADGALFVINIPAET